ncbi:MAG: hypothetical protein Q7R87_03290 [Nanoarchaeota archaeon]|nr:hypothetical protein [Nanoarchaeota archaeon]
MKRTHKEIILAILKVLRDGKTHSYGDIERKANTNWRTVRDNVELLVIFECAIIKEDRISIAEFGKRVYENSK